MHASLMSSPARHPWFRSVHLIFAAKAAMAAAHATAHIAVYSAADIAAYALSGET